MGGQKVLFPGEPAAMPLAFPSHQGFVAPLWRRWPDRFHVLAMCIGAAVPDVVDGIAGAFRGHLGQWYGHSLIGLLAAGLPLGLLLTWLVAATGRRLSRRGADRLRRAGDWIQGLCRVPDGLSAARRIGLVALSVWVGGVSHLFFDSVSHGGFHWLRPWWEAPRLFASWWYDAWVELPVPGYEAPYPIGPHFAAWVLLSVAGAVLLCLPLLRSGAAGGPGPDETRRRSRPARRSRE